MTDRRHAMGHIPVCDHLGLDEFLPEQETWFLPLCESMSFCESVTGTDCEGGRPLECQAVPTCTIQALVSLSFPEGSLRLVLWPSSWACPFPCVPTGD